MKEGYQPTPIGATQRQEHTIDQWDARSFAFGDYRFTLDRAVIEDLTLRMKESSTGRQWPIKDVDRATTSLDVIDNVRSQYVYKSPG